MLKVELHSHTADDPCDRIPYSTFELIDRAASLGYHAIAITLHERQLDVRPFASYAADRGVVLIPGIERTVEGGHVLLLNFREGTDGVRTFDDLARLRAESNGLVIAPHPFFPIGSSLRGMMDVHAPLFDAVEVNGMYTASLDFNHRAVKWARAHGKPLVGNGDIHRLHQLDTCYSLVDAEPTPDAICAAVAAGRVSVERRPLSWMEAGRTMNALVMSDVVQRAERTLNDLSSLASAAIHRRVAP